MASPPTIVGIDTGGTFTDLVAICGGTIRIHKVLSTPSDPARAVLRGLRELLGETEADVITYGSTVATNALLERRGARVVLVTTYGFEDLIEIGRQNRPVLYALEPQRPEPLVPRSRRVGVSERVTFDGNVLVPLTRAALKPVITAIKRMRPDAIAICFLHAYSNAKHEQLAGKLLSAATNLPCSLSHQLVAEHREYERLSTTVINAYVQPVMSRHLGTLQRHLGKRRLRVMQSNGGAISAAQAAEHAVRTVLSGPAAGVIGASRVAASLGIDRAITFDMGGTSTDVSLIDGKPNLRNEWEIGDLPLKVPALDIHTVGAGGGSLARLDCGGALKVGPDSAGADPGPACYGTGTEPTVTDANVLLGRLVADDFLGGGLKLDVERARRAVQRLGREMKTTVEVAAEGIVRVANAGMERAIRRISVERGHDPREYALIAFGGAAGQHACELAASLGIRRVVAPAHTGVLSAWGAAAADVQRDYVRTVRLSAVSPNRLRRLFEPLEKRGNQALRKEGIVAAQRVLQRWIDLRYRGQSFEIRIALTDDYAEAFHREHQRSYGYADPSLPIEIVSLRLLAIGKGPRPGRVRMEQRQPAQPIGHRLRWNRRWLAVPRFARDRLPVGAEMQGPVLITELSATTVVLPGWRAVLHKSGHLEMTDEN